MNKIFIQCTIVALRFENNNTCSTLAKRSQKYILTSTEITYQPALKARRFIFKESFKNYTGNNLVLNNLIQQSNVHLLRIIENCKCELKNWDTYPCWFVSTFTQSYCAISSLSHILAIPLNGRNLSPWR